MPLAPTLHPLILLALIIFAGIAYVGWMARLREEQGGQESP